MAPVSQNARTVPFVRLLTILLKYHLDGVDTKILREWSSSLFENIPFQQCPVFVH